MYTPLQPKLILLDICGSGEFNGKEAHSALNKVSKEIHQAILDNCGFFKKTSLVHNFYNLFDQSCFRWFVTNRSTEDLSVIAQIEEAPAILSYLLETAILSDEIEEFPLMNRMDKKSILAFFQGAKIFYEACNFSNYLFRNDFTGGFTLSKNGIINFRIPEKIEKAQQGFVKKMSLYHEKIRPDETKMSFDNKIKRVSLAEDAEPYDPLFRRTYGIRLSTIVESTEAIISDACKKRYGVVPVSQNALFKKIKRRTHYKKREIKKALNFLEIDKDMLSKDYRYFKFFETPISVSRRPIIRLFHGSGEKGNLVYLGPNALIRSLSLIFADINRGILKISNLAENWDNEKGLEFEKRVKLILAKRGFKVIRVTDAPPNVGEIDAVAFHEKSKLLLILEAKAPKIDILMDKAKWHFERSRKWCQKVDMKVEWAKKNSKKLIRRLDVADTKVNQVIGLIITRVPWYVEDDLPYRVLSMDEFERFLDRVSNV